MAAVAICFTRPDGLLYCAATVGAAGLLAFTARPGTSRLRLVARTAPLLLVVARLCWRYSFYGDWLPNTYYAKVVAAWPLIGSYYLISFVLEYGLWLFLALGLWALLRWLGQVIGRRGQAGSSSGAWLHEHGRVALVTLTLLAHGSYYTFVVGGDHFEYRVYNHFLPFLFLALFWLVNQLVVRPHRALILVVAQLLVSLPTQWTHWALSRHLESRSETVFMRVPIAPSWPASVAWYGRLFDGVQAGLIAHSVCLRHQEHKVFCRTQLEYYPPREEGAKVSSSGFPVLSAYAVGVPAWTLPHVNIIDALGLNDYVIARMPIPESQARLMAHDRRPPEGYLESYRANVTIQQRATKVQERDPPLTADEIRRLETVWRATVVDKR